MPVINYLAVLVAALAAFLASSIWYIVFGKELAKVSKAFAGLRAQKRQPWKMLIVIVQSLVISFVVAYVIGLRENVSWLGAVGIGLLLWLGLSAMQWVGSMLWEQVSLKMAIIHAGDWLVKLIVISTIVGAWR
jgi:hypothetical protein